MSFLYTYYLFLFHDRFFFWGGILKYLVSKEVRSFFISLDTLGLLLDFCFSFSSIIEVLSIDVMWFDEWHSFLRVWVPFRGFLCLFWRETHTKGLCARFPTRPEEDEERKGPWAVNWIRQSAEESSQQKPGEGDGQRKAAAKRGVGTYEPGSQVSQRERISQRSWWLCRNFARIHARDSPQIHRMLEKCQIPSPSCA